MSMENHIKHLKEEHDKLDKAIKRMEHAAYDHADILFQKKKKLQLKDEITLCEQKLRQESGHHK